MMHLPSYAAGLVFHAGVFAAFALLAAEIAGFDAPAWIRWPLATCAAAGGLGGAVLVVKRTVTPNLRGLSSPDDYVANLLSSAFAVLACAAAFAGAWTAAWLGAAVALLLYIPFGKIRHCVFFFTTRYYLGAFFGRRGTFPTAG
jgi:nitrate reductase gamma subunit